MKIIIHTDGGARANNIPGYGPGSSAFIARSESGSFIANMNEAFEHESNNTAEYRGVLLALHHFREIADRLGDGPHVIEFRADSRMMVDQINKRRKCKAAHLIVLRDKVYSCLSSLRLNNTIQSAKIIWVCREKNEEADKLCNMAMDGMLARDLFQSFQIEQPAARKNGRRGTSAGQMFQAGVLTSSKAMRVDLEGYALCGGCASRLIECRCPPMEMPARVLDGSKNEVAARG